MLFRSDRMYSILQDQSGRVLTNDPLQKVESAHHPFSTGREALSNIKKSFNR